MCSASESTHPSHCGAPATAAEALAAVRAGLSFLASVDAAELADSEQADLVLGLAAAESAHVAATARLLTALDTSGGFATDGCPTTKAWLRWQARTTSAAAGVWMGWARRLLAHPGVAAALAAGRLSPPWARQLCDWIGLLPEDAHADAEQILLDAASAGCKLGDLAALAEEIRARTGRPDTDDADRFGERRLHLSRHYQGHARLDGDLTPQAGAALRAVLDALNKRVDAEDLRSPAQRDHDALHELCQRIIASGVPDTAGQHTSVNVHMTLSQLLGQSEADPAAAAWIAANGVPAAPGADCDRVQTEAGHTAATHHRRRREGI